MKEKGLRCVVDLQLKQVSWEDKDGANLQLTGGPIFLRICLLGQLGYSDLKVPTFPVSFEQTSKYERVYTNCRDPSLIQEVMRGEHVRIEMIQVNDDYQGGKIVARYEGPLNSFLFEFGKNGQTEDRESSTVENRRIVMNKSRKYENPPILHFNTMMSITETIIQSPIDVIWGTTQQSGDPSAESAVVTPNRITQAKQQMRSTTPRVKQEVTSQVEPNQVSSQQGHSIRSMLRPDGLSDSSQDGTTGVAVGVAVSSPGTHEKPKPTSTTAANPIKHLPKVTYSPHRSAKHTKPALQPTDGDCIGPHCYDCCPKKLTSSQERQMVEADIEENFLLSHSEKPPFVVRHVDDDLISKRDFPKLLRRDPPKFTSSTHYTSHTPNRGHGVVPRTSVQGSHREELYTGETLSHHYEQYVTDLDHAREIPQFSRSLRSFPPSSRKTARYMKPMHTPQPKPSSRNPRGAMQPTGVCVESEDSELSQEDDREVIEVARLQAEPGNVRVRAQSPSRILRERISHLMEQCCERMDLFGSGKKCALEKAS
jgi:hypothetical protein